MTFYLCNKSFFAQAFNQNGYIIENEVCYALKGSVWKRKGRNVFGGKVHLEDVTTGDSLEISEEVLRGNFIQKDDDADGV